MNEDRISEVSCLVGDINTKLAEQQSILARVEALCQVIDRSRPQYQLRQPQGQVPGQWSRNDRIRQLASSLLPEGATVAVISKGDEDLLQLGRRTGWHFPQSENGNYAGYYPANSAEAIVQLERLRQKGAGFLLIPSTSFWWLAFYTEFKDYLALRYRLVAYQDDACAIFTLGEETNGTYCLDVRCHGAMLDEKYRRRKGRYQGGPGEAAPPASPAPSAPLPTVVKRSRQYLQAGEPLAAWQEIKSLGNGVGDVKLVLPLAYALRRNGNLSAAREAFQDAMQLKPEDKRLGKYLDMVEGEVKLLSGGWMPPPIKARRFEPVRGRILHIVGKSLPYAQVGYTLRTHYVASCQRDSGLDPQVVTQLGFPLGDGKTRPEICDVLDGISYHRLLPADSLPLRQDERLSLNLADLADLVQEIRPAALHAASDFINCLLALELGKKFGIPVVYEMRGFWEETWLSKHGDAAAASEAYLWRHERELQCALAADFVVTLSDGMRKSLAEQGVPENKVIVIPNGVDTQAFSPIAYDYDAASRLGIQPGELVVGYISSFVAYEGIHILLEAVARLLGRGHQVRALLVGDGETRQFLEERAADLKISDRVIFTGRVSHYEVPGYYQLIDIFVVPRTADRVSQLVTPLKPVEAMAMEKAVVVSGVQALKEMVQEGITGLVFRPEDSEHLANVVEPLLHDPERRRALGRAARVWVCEHRTWTQNGRLYLELYQSQGVV